MYYEFVETDVKVEYEQVSIRHISIKCPKCN